MILKKKLKKNSNFFLFYTTLFHANNDTNILLQNQTNPGHVRGPLYNAFPIGLLGLFDSRV